MVTLRASAFCSGCVSPEVMLGQQPRGLPCHSSMMQTASCHVQGAGGVYKGFAVDLALLPSDGAPPADALVDLLQVRKLVSRLHGMQSTAQAFWLPHIAFHRQVRACTACT